VDAISVFLKTELWVLAAYLPLKAVGDRPFIRRSGTPKFPIHCTFTVRLALANHLESAVLAKNLTGFISVRSALGFSSEQCSCALYP
jgi:hypothetical protein